MENLAYGLTGGMEAVSIQIVEGYEQPTARCSIVTPDYGGLSLGDKIEVTIGFDGDNGKVFEGYVQNINSERMPGYHIIEAEDILIRAAEYLIVSIDLDNPFRRWNITAEDLIEDLLNEAGITDYTSGVTGFTFATGEVPVEFNLTFAWEAVQQIANVVAWHVYADQSGQVHFENIKPEPSGAPVASYTTGGAGNLIIGRRTRSTERLRNKVVVFGNPPIKAEDSAVSPYLPAGFYKTAVVSSVLIDTQSMADTTASYNLSKWNKLTEALSVEALGDYARHARQTVSVTETFSGASGNWFIHDITHAFGEDTYVIRMNLVK